MDFVICEKFRKQLLDNQLDILLGLELLDWNCFQKVIYKGVGQTGEITGNKIVDKTVKPKHASDDNPRNVEQIVILPEKIEELLNQLR